MVKGSKRRSADHFGWKFPFLSIAVVVIVNILDASLVQGDGLTKG